MALQPIQFASQSYQDRSLPVSAQRLVNLYLQANPREAKSAVTLHGTPGLKLFASVGTGPIRGIQAMGGQLYVISGNSAYLVRQDGTSTELGAIPETGPVQMAANITQVAVVTSTRIFVLTETAVQEVNDPGAIGDLPGATDVTYQDGYGIFTRGHGEQFFISALDDFTTLAALDLSSVDGDPDDLVGLISDHRELWLFGKKSIEQWYNDGNAVFPFSRTGQGFIERGCASGRSIAKADNNLFWLGDDLRFYAAKGYDPIPISTPAIDKLVGEQSSPHTARAFTYAQEGHTFYCCSFTGLTLAYDVSSGLWHERETDSGRWAADCHSYVFRKNIVGDASAGKLYELDLDTYTDNGTTISRRAITPPIDAQGHRGTMSRFFLEAEGGVGLTTGQGSDPQAMLDWTDDGGRTWSNEVWAAIGKIGEYGNRATWSRLGQFRSRSMRVTITDPVKVAISGAYAEFEARQ